jgi:protein SCO1
MKKAYFIFLAMVLASTCASGHESQSAKADIGLEEKLGQYIPSNTMFTDERGQKINLASFIDKPTIIAPIYLSCTHQCPLLLSGLAVALGKLALVKPGKDYQVVTLSFDDTDTPKIAAEKKVNYIKLLGKSFPENSWKFLTGDTASIKSFTDSIGFKFQRDGEHEFSHPVVLVIVAPSGKIVRYIEGTTFLPFELTMALTEAAEGRVGSSARKALLYCFSYDPLKKSYVFNILQITGIVMILFVGAFLAYLLISAKRKKGDQNKTA